VFIFKLYAFWWHAHACTHLYSSGFIHLKTSNRTILANLKDRSTTHKSELQPRFLQMETLKKNAINRNSRTKMWKSSLCLACAFTYPSDHKNNATVMIQIMKIKTAHRGWRKYIKRIIFLSKFNSCIHLWKETILHNEKTEKPSYG